MIARVLIIAKDHAQAARYSNALGLDHRFMNSDVFHIITLQMGASYAESHMWDLAIWLSNPAEIDSTWRAVIETHSHAQMIATEWSAP